MNFLCPPKFSLLKNVKRSERSFSDTFILVLSTVEQKQWENVTLQSQFEELLLMTEVDAIACQGVYERQKKYNCFEKSIF